MSTGAPAVYHGGAGVSTLPLACAGVVGYHHQQQQHHQHQHQHHHHHHQLSEPLGTGPASPVSKGRRTVKGLPGSSLSLETTLRVISELGPTIRMERGKVIRMFSCPWCLRHFTRKENLKLHVRYIHGPLESLTCKLCGNKYKNSNSLRVHSYLYHNAQRNGKAATTTTTTTTTTTMTTMTTATTTTTTTAATTSAAFSSSSLSSTSAGSELDKSSIVGGNA